MVMRVRDDGGSAHDGSCKGGRQHSDVRDILEVESIGLTDGLAARGRMMPGPGIEEWVDRGAISRVGSLESK